MRLLPMISTLAIVLAGCGGGGGGMGGTTPSDPKPTCSIVLNPQAVTAGQSSQLTWSTNGASASDPLGGTALSGSQAVSPSKTTIYTLSATSSGGASASCSATLTVNAPAIVISVSPSSVSVQTGATQQFTATVTGNANMDVTWSVVGCCANGTIDTSGIYTAPAAVPNPETISILATSKADPSKSGSASVTITRAPWRIGGGSFTGLRFTSAIPEVDRTYITNLFNQAYPVAVQLLGSPPDTSVLTVDVCSWAYGEDWHTICVTTLPTTSEDTKDSWQYHFLHELCHGMTVSQYTGVGPNWINEGYADTGARLIRRAFGQTTGVYSMAEMDFDILRLGGKEIVGGIEGKSWRPEPQSSTLNEDSGADLFEILVSTQSNAQIGDWQEYTALKDLKAAQYAIANEKQARLTEEDFFTALRSTFSRPIEGRLPDEWVAAQPVANIVGTPGTYLYVYPAPAANPQWLEAACFTRVGQNYASSDNEKPCTSGQVTITITNAAKVAIATINLDLASASHELTIDTSQYPLGAYRIQASGTANGDSVTAPDSYFGRYDATLAPPGREMGGLGSVLFLIGKNPDGSPSGNPLPEPVNGPAGKFLQNTNGAAIWQVNSASPNPQAEYDWLGRRLYVPLPFSPVFLGENL